MKSKLMKCLQRHLENIKVNHENVNMVYLQALIRSGAMWDLYEVPRETVQFVQFTIPLEIVRQQKGIYLILNPKNDNMKSIVNCHKNYKNPISKIWKDWIQFQNSLECFYYTTEGICDDN